MSKIIINSELSFVSAVGELRADFIEHKHLTLGWKAGVDRSVQVNRLWGAMYKRLHQFGLFTSFNDARSYCKLYIAVPILMRDCEDFKLGWYEHFAHVTNERLLEYMGPNKLFGPNGFPVTSLFSRKQGTEYTNAIADNHDFVASCISFADLLRSD